MKKSTLNIESPEYRDLVSKLVGKPVEFLNLPEKDISVEKIGFTGLKDTDLLILMQLEDKELFEVCSLNKYLYSLCNNEHFWYNRIVKKYGEEVAKQKNKNTWKKYYIHLIKNNLKLYFDGINNFYLSSKKLKNEHILLRKKVIIPKIGEKLYAFVPLNYESIMENEVLVFTDKKELQKYFNKIKNKKISYIKEFTRELNLYL